jgi:hypothetical protein
MNKKRIITEQDAASALVDALHFYADPLNYEPQGRKYPPAVIIDRGARARRAREIVRQFSEQEKGR